MSSLSRIGLTLRLTIGILIILIALFSDQLTNIIANISEIAQKNTGIVIRILLFIIGLMIIFPNTLAPLTAYFNKIRSNIEEMSFYLYLLNRKIRNRQAYSNLKYRKSQSSERR